MPRYDEAIPLNLYRRQRQECEGGRPEDSRSGEFEEREKVWKTLRLLLCVRHSERHLQTQIHGQGASREGLPADARGKVLAANQFFLRPLYAKSIIEKKFGYRLMPDRVAKLTVPRNGRRARHYYDQCQRGCHTSSYFNSPSVTLPAAAKTGRFTLPRGHASIDCLLRPSPRVSAHFGAIG
jgi:hypothetical protein